MTQQPSLRILLQCHSFLACNLELANRLCDSNTVQISTIGFELEPFAGEFDRFIDSRIQCHKWASVRLRSATYYSHRLQLLKLAKEADIIHCQCNTDPILNLIMLWWLNHTKAPSILTVHDPKPHSGEDILRKKQWVRTAISDKLISRHPNLLNYSQYSAQLMREYYPLAGSHTSAAVWHGGLDFLTRYPSLPAPSDTPTVLLAGRLSKYKGTDVMLKAWKQVAAQHPTARLIVVGTGLESTSVQQLIDDTPNVVFVNRYVSHREMAEFFAQSHLVVLPYLDATQSGIQATALAFEKPVVASNVGAISEMLEDGQSGLLVPPGDVNALAAAVSRCLGSKQLLDQLREGSARLHRGRLSWNELYPQILGHYHAVLG